jgi:hypothetical protein
MADVVFVAAALGFFAVCVLYVRACERIVTSEDEPGPTEV